MNRTLLSLLLVVLLGCPVLAQDQVKIVQLDLYPAAPPRLAFQYQLFPGITGLLPEPRGNAAVYYYAAVERTPSAEESKKISEWLKMPLDELPLKDIQALLTKYKLSMRQLEYAARCGMCDWQLPVERFGYGTLLPGLSGFQSLSRLLALQVRVCLAQHDYNKAIDTLRTGLAFGRNVAQAPVLINGLVGVAIESMMLKRVEEMISLPDAPNLYWALTALPTPFIDIRWSVPGEMDSVYADMPAIRDIKTRKHSREEWIRMMQQGGVILRMSGMEPNAAAENKSRTLTMALIYYSRAKNNLLAIGYTQEQVDAMCVPQVLVTAAVDEFEYWRQSASKWFAVPYWQAHEGLKQTEAAFEDLKSYNPLAFLLPAWDKAYLSMAKAERQVAALRCIEALRLYAAAHDGALPVSLDEIREVPIPTDPVTGKPFTYTREGNHVVLESSPPTGEDPSQGMRYELTLKHAKH